MNIAMVLDDAKRRESFLKRLAQVPPRLLRQIRLCLIKNPSALSSPGSSGDAQIDVLCLDASEEGLVESACTENRELILLDASHDRLRHLLRFKPIASLSSEGTDSRELGDALNVALGYLRRRGSHFLTVQCKERSLRVPHEAIFYLESSRKRVILHTSDDNNGRSFFATLDSVQQAVSSGNFVRCHQSYLVNADYVREIDRTRRSLVLANGDSVSISDRYYREMVELFSPGKPGHAMS